MADSLNIRNDKFDSLITYTEEAKERFGASAAALLIVQNNKVITEWYSGMHHDKKGALKVSNDSMFNLYSLRKTYVGLATAIALVENNISIDDKVSDHLFSTEYELGDSTIRELATKTGAKYFGANSIEREEVACDLIKALTGRNIAELITERIFKPLQLKHSEWISIPRENLVCDFQAAGGYASVRIGSNVGHERNLYTNARDLAYWGNIHLNRGCINANQLIPEEVYMLNDQLRQETNDKNRIFGWYYQDKLCYASGAAGCHCVIIPEYNAIAVRMLNKYTEDYTEDQNKFNDLFYQSLQP